MLPVSFAPIFSNKFFFVRYNNIHFRRLFCCSDGFCILNLGFPCAITFYSILGKLQEIAFLTQNKYILKVIIKKLAFWKIHIYGYTCSKFQRNDAQNVYYSSDIHNNRDTGKQFFVLPIRFLVVACNKMNFKFVPISQPSTEQVLRYYCAIAHWKPQ